MTQNKDWLLFYKNEEELINAVGAIDVHKFNEYCADRVCSGYQYITRISRAINAGVKLTDPQIRQIQRLAKQVYKYHKTLDNLLTKDNINDIMLLQGEGKQLT